MLRIALLGVSAWAVISFPQITAEEHWQRTFDGSDPSSGLGDVAWGVAERPKEMGGGFLLVGEHLLDEKVDSHNRVAMIIVTDPQGKPVRRILMEGWMHASRIESLKDGCFAIPGNKRGHGSSVLIVDGNGDTVAEHTRLVTDGRPNAALSLTPTRDGGYLLGCADNSRGFITKLNKDWSPEWSTPTAPNLWYIKSAVEAPNGHFYMVGQAEGGKGVHIVRWDQKGQLVEQHIHKIDRSTNKGRKIIVDRKGRLVITGMLGSGGSAGFAFLVLDPQDLKNPLLATRIRPPGAESSNYGQNLFQARDGSYVIVGRSAVDGVHHLSLCRVDEKGEILGEPSYFGNKDPKTGHVGYHAIETRDGSIAAVGVADTTITEASDITDVRPAADFFLLKAPL